MLRITSLVLTLFFFVQFNTPVFAGEDLPERPNFHSDTLNKTRLRILTIGGGAAYGITMIGLNELWYKDQPRSAFHFFNDNAQWKQMDKGGHMVSAYYGGKFGYHALRWAGVPEKKAIWYGGSLGFTMLLPIEILDGFSAGWGASWGDLLANAAGSALFISQQLAFEEQKVRMKYSYFPVPESDLRPAAFGYNTPQKMIKDYNSITYWFSMHPGGQESPIPEWLNISAGYSARGMLGGTENRPFDDHGNPLPQMERYRQYLLSPDINLSKIPTRHKGVKLLLNVASIVKFPAPALEFNRIDGVKFHPIYF